MFFPLYVSTFVCFCCTCVFRIVAFDKIFKHNFRINKSFMCVIATVLKQSGYYAFDPFFLLNKIIMDQFLCHKPCTKRDSHLL